MEYGRKKYRDRNEINETLRAIVEDLDFYERFFPPKERPLIPKEELCPVCKRKSGTVEVGATRFCEKCVQDLPEFKASASASTAKQIAAQKGPRHDPDRRASQSNAPGGWWNTKER